MNLKALYKLATAFILSPPVGDLINGQIANTVFQFQTSGHDCRKH